MVLQLTLIVAATVENGIGVSGGLPWRLPKEMAYFSKATSTAPSRAMNAVVMGRKSWESIPPKYRPLPNRFNVVVSRQPEYNLGSSPANAVARPSIASAIQLLSAQLATTDDGTTTLHRAFVIGGASIYSDALALDLAKDLAFVNRILLTRILSPSYPDCDVFFPNFQAQDAKWTRAAHSDLVSWLGFDVPEEVQEERGATYEYQMWVR